MAMYGRIPWWIYRFFQGNSDSISLGYYIHSIQTDTSRESNVQHSFGPYVTSSWGVWQEVWCTLIFKSCKEIFSLIETPLELSQVGVINS